MIEQYIQALTELTMVKKPDFGNGTSVLSLLYEAYSELNLMDTDQVKAAFKTLYHTMNGKSLEEMDVILYPVIHHRRLSAYTDEPAVVILPIKTDKEVVDQTVINCLLGIKVVVPVAVDANLFV